MYKELNWKTEDMQEELSAFRRDLHAYPEPGWMEMRTTSLVAEKLRSFGYEVLTGREVCLTDSRMGVPSAEALEEHYQWAKAHGAAKAYLEQTKEGHTGVIGILHCGEGPVVAMRFDLDALGVHELEKDHFPAEEGFCSRVPGIMHACGHDGHTTIGIGVAEILSKIRGRLQGTIKLIFQPAEEGVRGAKSIVEHGHLDDVDVVLGTHMAASKDGGLHVCPGMAGTLATTKLDVTMHGKAAHAGISPQEGQNALLAAAIAILNIQAIPRHQKGISRVNVGTLHAGTGRNVICDRARMEIEVRGETTEVNDYMEHYTRSILEHAAAMHGCKVEIELAGSAAAIECTPELTQRICEICRTRIGLDVTAPVDMGGSEDFAYMTKQVIDHGGSACFTGLQVPVAGPFHSAGFDFDERGLVLGVKYYVGVVYDLLHQA